MLSFSLICILQFCPVCVLDTNVSPLVLNLFIQDNHLSFPLSLGIGWILLCWYLYKCPAIVFAFIYYVVRYPYSLYYIANTEVNRIFVSH